MPDATTALSPSSEELSEPALLLKYIRCRVEPGAEAAFSRGQEAWRGLSGLPGFRGQIGGWSQQEEGLGVILALWTDRASEERFMKEEHGPLFQRSGQQSLLRSLSVDRLAFVEGIEYPAPRPEQGPFRGIGVLRIAECLLFPGRVEHFVHSQERVWNPAMHAHGVLTTGFWQDLDRPLRFLVATLWTDRDAHLAWRRSSAFTECWKRAGVEEDCESVTGHVVPVEKELCVDWKRG